MSDSKHANGQPDPAPEPPPGSAPPEANTAHRHRKSEAPTKRRPGLFRQIFFPPRSRAHQHVNGGSLANAPAAPSPPEIEQTFQRAGCPHEVTCFRCGYDYAMVPEAALEPCVFCGELLDFRDHIVAGFFGRRVRTLGDVFVKKGGCLVGAPVSCENLKVEGEVSGPLDCPGTVELMSSGRITGRVQCGQLVIGEGADVTFLQPVKVARLDVRGHILAEIDCAGKATVAASGVLDGSIVAGVLAIEPGGSVLAVTAIRAGRV